MSPLLPHLALAALTTAASGWSPSGLRAPAPGTPAGEVAHPQDGPDVDLRIELEEDSLRIFVTFNLAYIDEVTEFAREQAGQVHSSEEPGLRRVMLAHVLETASVSVDDVEITPVDIGFRYEPADPDLVPLFPNAGARGLARGQLELDYPILTTPHKLEMTWGSFPENTAIGDPGEAPPIEIDGRITVAGQGDFARFRDDARTFEWRGEITPRAARFVEVPDLGGAGEGPTLPLLSTLLLGLALTALCWRPRQAGFPLAIALGAGAWLARAEQHVPVAWGLEPEGLTDEQALQVFGALHANIYRAFDYRDESDVYDALARSVSGELLRSLYDQIYASLVLQEEGGAVCKITSVDVQEAAVLAREAATQAQQRFDVQATWQVNGSVFHFGHSHHRTNEYEASYGLERGEGGWRITSHKVLAQKRVEAQPAPPQSEGEL